MENKENALAVHGEASGNIVAHNPRNNLIPRNMTELMEFSKLMAKSSIVPKDFQGKPENVMIAVQMGVEVGMAPMQAIQSIAVINGRPSMYGDAVLALVQASGLLDFIEEWDQGRAEQEKSGYCRVKRKGDASPHEVRFTEAQAKRAGLVGKSGPWTQYPGRMMQMRARAFALRDKFPDVLRGLHIREEAEDIEMERVAESYMPKRVVTEAEPVIDAVIEAAPSIEVEKTEAPTAPNDLPSFGAPDPEPAPVAAPVKKAAAAPVGKINKEQSDVLIGLVRNSEMLMARLTAKLKSSGIASISEIPVDKYDAILAWAEEKAGA